jgi:UDP-N-acetylmuramoyl-tripeptide--D-alanyl-D-alanine ligase
MEIQELYSCFLECGAVSTDTRKIIPGSMFFALKGENFDANAFAEEALSKGAKYAVIDNPDFYKGSNTLLVANVLEALQQLARHHRRKLGLPVIALTGSNGKTTTKELINAVLSQQYATKATVGNLNNHIGVPLTLLSFTNDTEIGIVEMGANHQKEIEFLCSLAEPNFGYITNFGKAHLEGFGGFEGVIKGKSELYDYLEQNTKMAFVNLDDAIQEEKTKHLPRFSFSASDYVADIHIEAVPGHDMVRLDYGGHEIQSNLIGSYNAPNIGAAIAMGNYFKVSDKKIKAAIEGYIPSNNRSQLMEKGTNRIIMDAYNANPSSMAAAIANIRQTEGQRIAILGDMFELGDESPAEHAKLVEQMASLKDIETWFVGKDFYAARTDDDHLYFFPDFAAFSDSFAVTKPENKVILIKGSRGMALERTLELL